MKGVHRLPIISSNSGCYDYKSVSCDVLMYFVFDAYLDWFHCGGYSSPFGDRRRDGICPDPPGRLV